MTELEVLQRARERLLRPNGWCQRTARRVSHGVEQVCASAAVYWAADPPARADRLPHLSAPAWELYQRVLARLGVQARRLYPDHCWPHAHSQPLVWINDTLGLEAVLRVFDAAILDCAAHVSLEVLSEREAVPV